MVTDGGDCLSRTFWQLENFSCHRRLLPSEPFLPFVSSHETNDSITGNQTEFGKKKDRNTHNVLVASGRSQLKMARVVFFALEQDRLYTPFNQRKVS